jgi:hypothetical protein
VVDVGGVSGGPIDYLIRVDAERQWLRYNAERGNDQQRLAEYETCGSQLADEGVASSDSDVPDPALSSAS